MDVLRRHGGAVGHLALQPMERGHPGIHRTEPEPVVGGLLRLGDLHALLEEELAKPTLYHVALHLLEDHLGHRFDPAIFRQREPHEADDTVIAAWTTIYRAPDKHWTLYQLAEKLVDLEDYFRRWRFNHVTTVERVIGLKRGTGGTSGVAYLRRMLEVELFPELWHMRGGL